MAKADCCAGACRVEAVVNVDERGQMVLPKALRQRLKLKPGDGLALISWDGPQGFCCVSLVKAEALTALAGQLLGPVISDLTRGKTQRRKGG